MFCQQRDGEIATWAREKGAGLASAELLPGARLVRAFNAISYAKLPEAAIRQGERTGIPMAGDDHICRNAGLAIRRSRRSRLLGIMRRWQLPTAQRDYVRVSG